MARKQPPKAMSITKSDFIASLQNVVDTGNLLIAVLETALQHGAVSGKVKDIVEERLKEFRVAMYGGNDGTE